MAAPPPRPARRRPRRGTVDRPVNARMYRGTWLLVGIPLLVAAFSVSRATALPAPALPPTFDVEAARLLAVDLASSFPAREPGSATAREAARWVAERFRVYGFEPQTRRFTADVAGLGRRRLENVFAVVPGRSDATIVVSAHRDSPGIGRGTDDNASGTAALVELARTYARAGAAGRAVVPEHRLVFLSTDAGAFGGHGAARFAEDPTFAGLVVAVVNLDSLATGGPARLVMAGDTARSPSPALLQTAAERLAEEAVPVRHAGPLAQLVDLGFPFTLHEQGPFLARGIPAVTVSAAAEQPQPATLAAPPPLDVRRFAELGRGAQQLLVSLDESIEQRGSTNPLLYFGPRLVPGWAVELVLIASVLPFLAGAVDLFARCRRRRVPLMPALRSYRRRLVVWLVAGALFGLLALAGAWIDGEARPPSPSLPAAAQWPFVVLGVYAAVVALVWLVARDPLLPRREVTREEELGGYTAALLVLSVVALLVVATNAFALVFVLPSLHAWLWLPQVHHRGAWARFGVLTAGFAGPLLLLWSFAARFDLGADAIWYLLALLALGYVELPLVLVGIAWLAVAAQLTAVAGRRYAPYPPAAERPPRGPLRQLLRRTLAARRARATEPERPRLRALG